MNTARIEALIRAGYRYAYTLTGSRNLAEDLTREAWLESQKHWLGPTKAYLFRALRRRWSDRFGGGPTRFEVLEADLDDGSAHAVALEELLNHQGLVAEAWRRLALEDRELLFLAVVEGFSVSEIARQIGSNRTAARSRIHRARMRLRRRIERAGKGNHDAQAF